MISRKEEATPNKGNLFCGKKHLTQCFTKSTDILIRSYLPLESPSAPLPPSSPHLLRNLAVPLKKLGAVII